MRPGRESNPRTGLCRPLPKPLGHPAGTGNRFQRETPEGAFRADDGIRTRDPNLGKVVLYQLSHVRVSQGAFCPARQGGTLADSDDPTGSVDQVSGSAQSSRASSASTSTYSPSEPVGTAA